MVELSTALSSASISAPVPKICLPEIQNYARCGIVKMAFKHLLSVIAKMADMLGWSSWEVCLPRLQHICLAEGTTRSPSLLKKIN